MRVDVWSDVVCPWCYLGKRRLEGALARFGHEADVEVVWRSFELDPEAPRRRDTSAAEHLAQKYGMSADQVAESWARLTALAKVEGLDYRLDRTRGGSTFDAHRLTHLGAHHGIQGEVTERLFHAYFSEGLAIGQPDVLESLAIDAGLPPEEVVQTLTTDRFSGEVRADEREARLLGVNGVPFFVFDGRYGVSGAQSADLLHQALETAWGERDARHAASGR